MIQKLILTLLLALLFSCTEQQKRDAGVMPSSSGAHDEILIVIDDKLWEGELGDSIFTYFAGDYPVLPQSEPVFRINQTNYQNFSDLFSRFRNVLFIGVPDESNKTNKHIKNILGEKHLERAMSDKQFYSVAQRDRWAKPQVVVYLFALDRERLKQVISQHSDRIISMFQNEELKKYKAVVYFKGKEEMLSRQVSDQFGFTLDIPFDYFIAYESADFMWLRKIENDVLSNILIHVRDVPADHYFTNEAISIRDSLGRQYVSSTSEGSYMITDTLSELRQQYVHYKGLPAYENRGLWRMNKDFMGGPFHNYLIHDAKNNRLIFLEGFVFAPGKDKKQLMRQLEAVFSTLDTNSNL